MAEFEKTIFVRYRSFVRDGQTIWMCAGVVDNHDGTFRGMGQTCEAPNREWALGLWMSLNRGLVGLKVEPDHVE